MKFGKDCREYIGEPTEAGETLVKNQIICHICEIRFEICDEIIIHRVEGFFDTPVCHKKCHDLIKVKGSQESQWIDEQTTVTDEKDETTGDLQIDFFGRGEKEQAYEENEIKRISRIKNFRANIYASGLYWGKRKNRAEHDNHFLSTLLYRNKRFNNGAGLTEGDIDDICNQMYLTLLQETISANIEIIVPVPNSTDPQRPEPRCAPVLAAGLAAIIRKREDRKNCNSYNDVLVRVSHTRTLSDKAGARHKSSENDYGIAGTAGGLLRNYKINSLIKDQTVLLIDDIITTGSTVNKCNKLISAYGAKKVIILCAAMTYWQ